MRRQWLKNDLSPLLRLAVPLAIWGVIQSSLVFFVTFFLAHLGETAVAAGALVNGLSATLGILILGTFGAINILISLKHGANDQTGISLVLRDGLLLAMLLAIPTFILFWNISSVFFLFRQSSELVELSKLYLHGLAWGLLPNFILVVLFQLPLGLGHPRTIMVIHLFIIPIYLFLSFALIFGKFGLPTLGIAGAGWGITLADWVIAPVLFIFLFCNKNYKPYIRSIFTLNKQFYFWEILHVGVPMGVMYCIEIAFYFAITLVMGRLSMQALVANQIVMQYTGPLIRIILSITQAVSIRMGHQLGANQVQYAKKTVLTGVFLSVVFTGLIALCYWTIPKVLISVDFDVYNPKYDEIVHLASIFLFIAAFFLILESAKFAYFGALRALKDTRFALMTSIISFWVISLPLGYLFAFPLGFGGAGLWCAMVIGSCIGVLLLDYRFKLKIKQLEVILCI